MRVVSQDLGINRSSLYRWIKLYKEQGEVGFTNPRRIGRTPKLSDSEIRKLIAWVRDSNPTKFSLKGHLWTAESLLSLVQLKLNIKLGKSALDTLLQYFGLGERRLQNRLARRGCSALNKWLTRDYPIIRQQAKKERLALFLCEIHKLRYTSDQQYKASDGSGGGFAILLATSPRGDTYFRIHDESINAKNINDFLRYLGNVVDNKICVIIDENVDKSFQLSQDHSLSKIIVIQTQNSESKTKNSANLIANNSELLAEVPPQADINRWVLLLNQSLLDTENPLSLFLSTLSRCMKSTALISITLQMPRAIYGIPPTKFSRLNPEVWIEISRGISKTWHANPLLSLPTKPGGICILDKATSSRTWKNSPFTHLIPDLENTESTLALCLQGTDENLYGLFIFRQSGMRQFSEQDKKFLMALRPHLEIAIELTIRTRRNLFTIRALEDATDHLEVAAMILDGSGILVESSNLARQLLDEKRYLMLKNQRLVFSQQAHQEKFEKAVSQAIGWRREPLGNKPKQALRFEYPSGHSIGVLVQPITPPPGEAVYPSVTTPQVVVFISDPTSPRPDIQRQLIAHLFNLSPREAQLTTLLANGNSLDKVAEIMGITKTSARTYLQHIYEKVGVKKQSDLMQQVMKSVALLA